MESDPGPATDSAQILKSCLSEHQSLRVQAGHICAEFGENQRLQAHTGDTQVSICLTTHLTQTDTQKGNLAPSWLSFLLLRQEWS